MPPEDYDEDELFGFPKPKAKEKRKVKHLRRGPMPKVRVEGKRDYNQTQREKRMEADRQYSHVTRPMYLLRLAQKQGRLVQNVSELPGDSPRAKLLRLPKDKNPLCEAGLSQTNCNGERVASTVHHTRGRGKHLNDESTFSGQCWPCHSYIERNREWAKENGFIVSRHEQVLTEEDF